MAAQRYEISQWVLSEIFFQRERNFVSPSGHVMFYLLYKHHSPPQRPLCVVGRLGRKKKRARGGRWEEGREKRGRRFPLPIVSARFLFFRLLIFWWGYPAGASAEERDINTTEVPNHFTLIVFWCERRDLLPPQGFRPEAGTLVTRAYIKDSTYSSNIQSVY